MNVRLLKRRREPPPHPVLRVVRVAAGAGIVLVGIIMLVTPGPGIVVILGGVWLLSADIRAARRLLMRVRLQARKARRKYRLYRERREAARENGGENAR